MLEVNTGINTDEELQAMLQMLIYIPSATYTADPVYVEVPIEIYEGAYPTELGEKEGLFSDWHMEQGRNDTHVSVKTANDKYHVINGEQVPNGNYTCISKEDLMLWVPYFGVTAFHVENPFKIESEDDLT